MKIKMKINRYIKYIGKDDLILDNGSCIQVVTQNGGFYGYSFGTLIMSKKLFNELRKHDYIYLDVAMTKKANERFNAAELFYFRFDVEKMAQAGYEVIEEGSI